MPSVKRKGSPLASPTPKRVAEDQTNKEMEPSEISCIISILPTSTSSGSFKLNVAFINLDEGSIGALQIDDGPRLTLLHAAISQLAPSLSIIPQGTHDAIEQCLIQVSLQPKIVPRGSFKSEGVRDRLTALLNVEVLPADVQSLDDKCLAALSAVLETDLIEDRNDFKFVLPNLSSFLLISPQDLLALNVISTSKVAKGKPDCLSSYMDQCKSPLGSKMLSRWIRYPLRDTTAIQQRLDVVAGLSDDTGLLQSLRRDHLRLVPDLWRMASRIASRRATISDLVKLHFFGTRLEMLPVALSADSIPPAIHRCFHDKIEQGSANLKKFLQLIETTVDLDNALDGKYNIKPSFNPELAEKRKALDIIARRMEKEFSRVKDLLGSAAARKHCRLLSTASQGWYFRVPKSGGAAVRRNSKDLTIIDSRVTGVKFTSGRLRVLSNSRRDAESDLRRESAVVLNRVLEISATFIPVFHTLAEILGSLDVLCSFAHVASEASPAWVRPTVLPASPTAAPVLKLRACRHPLLDAMDEITFIPNDIDLGPRVEGFEPSTLRSGNEDASMSFQLITGSNFGGKTVYLKSAGLSVILAQMGSFVPCLEAVLTVRDRVCVRAGSGDSLLKGMSTFMFEMVSMSAILEAATRDSLVLIDELGRGTSIFDGFGLAWAMAEDLAFRTQTLGLFATHIHELTRLEKLGGGDRVGNIHATASVEDGRLQLLYKMAAGPTDRSFGLQVAEMAGYPAEVIADARSRMRELEDGGDGGDKQQKLGAVCAGISDVTGEMTALQQCLYAYLEAPDDEERRKELEVKYQTLTAAINSDGAE
eukprot:gnl/Dysnectes_brevis/3995_a5208_714.p1 GENE.gnl/Dysnectes_brevis/3995_a5208_714~~gnl/Dysnectes_brevis/3995_a5208_714.p1  ORF type:complete len:817 (+),score=164.91 gnl/Dysnectes_brevis/3995_a5208_714:32-2482(+)